jgi:hypothetical protein
MGGICNTRAAFRVPQTAILPTVLLRDLAPLGKGEWPIRQQHYTVHFASAGSKVLWFQQKPFLMRLPYGIPF